MRAARANPAIALRSISRLLARSWARRCPTAEDRARGPRRARAPSGRCEKGLRMLAEKVRSREENHRPARENGPTGVAPEPAARQPAAPQAAARFVVESAPDASRALR